MAEKKKKTRVGFYIDNELLAKCDNCLKATDAQQYLAQYITSAISGAVGDSENRIASILFKLTVELGITMNVLAAMADVDDETLRKLRIKRVEDAKRTNGSVTFAGVVKSQRGGN